MGPRRRLDLPSAPVRSRVVPGLVLEGDREAVVRCVLARTWDVAVVNARGSIEGGAGADPELVHQFRVAARRCRVVLDDLGRTLGGASRRELRSATREIFRSSGPLRDLHALADSADPLVADIRAAAPADALAALEERARSGFVRALRSERAERLTEAMRLLPFEGRGDRGPFAPYLERRFDERREAVRALAADVDAGTPASALHRLRRKVKSLRYLNDLRRALGAPGAARARRRTAELQSALGAYQDLVVAEHLARDLCLDLVDVARVRDERRDRAIEAAARFARRPP